MKKLTLTQQLLIANEQIESLRHALDTERREHEKTKIKLGYHTVTERRFDDLLYAIKMGMAEGKLPRQ